MTNLPARELPAVILAAGVGRRLGSLTADRPKAMLEIGGLTLLERQLRALEASGFVRAFIVTGHAAGLIASATEVRTGPIEIGRIHNPEYAVANNIVSLLAARDVLRDGFCLLNSDIIVDSSIIAEVATLGAGSWLVVDRDEPLGAEEMKVELDSAGSVRRINKALDPKRAVGEYIGVARFDAVGAAALLESADRIVRAGGAGLYYEDAIDQAASEIAAGVVPTGGRRWTEIDDQVDYQLAIGIAAALPEPGST